MVEWSGLIFIIIIIIIIINIIIVIVIIIIVIIVIIIIIIIIIITWSLTLREEQRLRVFENKLLRKIFGAKRDEVTEKVKVTSC